MELPVLKQMIVEYNTRATKISLGIPSETDVGIFRIKARTLIDQLYGKLMEVRNRVLQHVQARMKKQTAGMLHFIFKKTLVCVHLSCIFCASFFVPLLPTRVFALAFSSHHPDICRQFEGINSELLRNSTTSQEIVALKRYLAKIPGELKTLNEAIADVKLKEEFLLDNIFDIPDEDFRALLNAYEWPKKIKEVLNIQVSKIDEEYARFEAALKKRVADFQTELDSLAEAVWREASERML